MLKKSVKMRILRSIFTLILCIFGIVILLFNMSVSIYIKNIALDQLSYIDKEGYKVFVNIDDIESIREIQNTINAMRPIVSNIKTEVKSFLVRADYTIIETKTLEETNLIIEKIKQKGIPVNNINALHVKVESGDYYISTALIHNTEDVYLGYYIDVTNITNFAAMINRVLIFIIAIAMFVTTIIVAFLSERITNPVKKLSFLALELGKGNFTKAQEDLKLKEIELNELANSINKAAKQLEIYDKDQKIFFQNASHELRTPLMSIKCYAEGLQYGIMDKEKAVNTILDEVNRMSEMIEDLLYVSKIDNITRPYEINKYDLREILGIVAGRQKMIAENKGITFDFQFDEKEVFLKCNEKLMERAFTNLLSNAIRHANKYITLICKKTKNTIKISIIDDGTGISNEDLPHIFERFYKGKNGNHGIGLSIVKSIIEQMGGKVYVESSDTGANFTIEF